MIKQVRGCNAVIMQNQQCGLNHKNNNIKKSYLLPNRMKQVGVVMLTLWIVTAVILIITRLDIMDMIPVKVLSLFNMEWGDSNIEIGKIVTNGIGDELFTVWLIFSLYFVSFSREKEEDECIAYIRGSSLMWAMKVNIVIVGVIYFLVYDIMFLYFMYFCIFTPFFLFIIKFNLAVSKFRKEQDNNE